MSANSGYLEKGLKVYHNGRAKFVKDWHFVSDDGCHNSDKIVVEFTDGSKTGDSPWREMKQTTNQPPRQR